MKSVTKYNTCKGVSTLLTMCTPIISLIVSGIEIVSPAGKMSVTACLIFLIALLFMKDKIAENVKMPSALVLSIILFVLIIIIENILIPLKGILIATMVACGIDELTFKRIYKQVELSLPEQTKIFKHFGFIFTTTEKLEELNNERNKRSL